MDNKNIFLLVFIVFILLIVLIAFIYQSKNEKMKITTTILLIAFFCWGMSKDTQDGIASGIIMFMIVMGIGIFIWNKMNNERLKKEENIRNFINTLKAYGKYIELHPLNFREIRHLNDLPFDKEKLILESMLYIKYLDKEIQTLLLVFIPELAFYRSDVPQKGYNYFTFIKKIEDKIKAENIDMDKIRNGSEEEIQKMNSLLTKKDLDSDFPNELFVECENESKKINILLCKILEK